MECWGASGGDPQSSKGIPGKGGYTKGNISLPQNQVLYIFIGGEGGTLTNTNGTNYGGYNGGGFSGGTGGTKGRISTGGGGSTDIRVLVNSSKDCLNLSSLRTRIMVAAGGGGCGRGPSDDYSLYGGYGGGLIGGTGGTTSAQWMENVNANTGAGQTSTGNCSARPQSSCPDEYGSFGYANQTAVGDVGYGGGAGGGWYGGVKGHGRGGSGGSSFISGHTGCNAINPSTGAHLGASTTMTINNVNYRFTNTVMKAGNEVMPSPSGGTETGHRGNGYCKITWHPAL